VPLAHQPLVVVVVIQAVVVVVLQEEHHLRVRWQQQQLLRRQQIRLPLATLPPSRVVVVRMRLLLVVVAVLSNQTLIYQNQWEVVEKVEQLENVARALLVIPTQDGQTWADLPLSQTVAMRSTTGERGVTRTIRIQCQSSSSQNHVVLVQSCCDFKKQRKRR
jgi:hypothetical protein